MEAAHPLPPFSRLEQLHFAQNVLRQEAQALHALADGLPSDFCDAVELLHRCRGNVVITGMGKAGLIGQKLMATLASLGTRCHFLHPGEAVHGDLGRVQAGDVIVALSFSGETEEVVRILPSLRAVGTTIIAITGHPHSTLGTAAAVALPLGVIREACPHGLAPTTSTTAMLALGDALALVLAQLRDFGPLDFARNHPAGNLGRKLTRVEDAMRPLTDCRVARDGQTVREVLIQASRPGRRTGAIMLVNDDGQLTGIFTDSDLARLLERRGEDALDAPIREVMTRAPATIACGSWMSRAVGLLGERKISELPVVDDHGKPVGLIDITDLVGWLPSADADESPTGGSGVASSNDRFADDVPPTIPFPNPRAQQSRR
ncbi:MAG: SIS domain-containing protein [Pirellulaceae bacterium]